MTEQFLSFLWKYQLYDVDTLCVEGEKIAVISPGEQNSDAGPDFFNAKIKIGETIWVGNVEIHLKSSDWYRHNHNKDAAFDNVILHVVAQNDQEVYTSKGRRVVNAEIIFNERLSENFKSLTNNSKWISCADKIPAINPVVITSWLGKAGIERLEFRTGQIIDNLEKTVNDWEEVFYRQLARSYGFHVNSQPFEALAKSISYQIVKKHAVNSVQLEALFYGQAGFLLDDYSNDEYYNKLRKEYAFLKEKYGLKPIDTHLWKFMRLRPGNFPTIRIAQFVGLLRQNTSIFSAVIEAKDLKSFLNLLSVDVSEYWETHYTFGNLSTFKAKPLGEKSAKVIIINTIVPILFIYGKKLGLSQYQDRAIEILEEIKTEDNVIIKEWKHLDIIPKNAFDSQALLHLKTEYCDKKRCLECGIGLKIITMG